MTKKTGGGRMSPGKIFAIGAGVSALLGAGYLAYDYASSRKDFSEGYSDGNYLPAYEEETPKRGSGGSPRRGTDDFPLRNGSKGGRVTQLQEALSRRLGSSLFSKYTKIDGIFGSGTEAALKMAGFPIEVDEVNFGIITSYAGTSKLASPADTARKLHEYADARNLQGVLSILGKMNSTADYTAVNEPYKNQRVIARTIVTDLLDYTFAKDETAKTAIKLQFQRMGLKLDGATGRWSLSGLRGFRDIVTNRDTIVLDPSKNQIRVKRNTILGEILAEQNGVTLFKSIDNMIAAVPTAHISYV